MSGFIKSYRSIFEHPLLKRDHNARHLLSDLLHHVAWDATVLDWHGNPVSIKRGQLMMSSRQMQERFGFSRQVIRTAIEKLIRHQIVKINPLPNQGPMVITICNWDKYQSRQPTDNPPANQLPTHLQPTKEEREEREESKYPQTPKGANGADGFALDEATADQPSSASKPKRAAFTQSEAAETDAAIDAYNASAASVGFAPCVRLTDARRKLLLARLRDIGGLDAFSRALAAIPSDKFLSGRVPGKNGEAPYRLDLDRLLSTKSGLGDVLASLLDKAPGSPASGQTPIGSSQGYPDELEGLSGEKWRALIAAHAGAWWPSAKLGPSPASKTCRVPPELIAELNLADKYDVAGRATNRHDPDHPMHRHATEAAA